MVTIGHRRPGPVRRPALVAGAVVAGALLAACSSGPTAATSSTAPRTTTSVPAGSTTSTTAAPSPPTPTGPTRCPTTGLAVSVSGSTGAAGTLETTLAVRNTTGATCVLGGYPGLQLLGSGGALLPTAVVRKGSYPFTAMSPSTVTLAPGQTAYVNLGYSDVPVGTETTCPAATAFWFTPPNATDHLTVTATLAPCNHGTVVVSPVFPATGPDTQTTAPPS